MLVRAILSKLSFLVSISRTSEGSNFSHPYTSSAQAAQALTVRENYKLGLYSSHTLFVAACSACHIHSESEKTCCPPAYVSVAISIGRVNLCVVCIKGMVVVAIMGDRKFPRRQRAARILFE